MGGYRGAENYPPGSGIPRGSCVGCRATGQEGRGSAGLGGPRKVLSMLQAAWPQTSHFNPGDGGTDREPGPHPSRTPGLAGKNNAGHG